MTRPIGYYVHHHGVGHRQRALAVAALAPQRFVLIGTGLDGQPADISVLALPDDRRDDDAAFDGVDGERHRPEALHYAPLGHDGVRSRMAAVAGWIAMARPALIVADVSVEIAMLARLCATPVAYVRLGGRRHDEPHLEAFRAAQVLIAPFAAPLDDPSTADWIKRKTIYAPGLVARRVEREPLPSRVLVVCGRGGSSLSHAALSAAAQATPAFAWHVIGLDAGAARMPPNLTFGGWTDDPVTEIAQAQIVIGAAGDGLVGLVLAARRPFVCIPEPRPFDEQQQKADALQRTGAAIVLARWPDPDEWADILTAALGIDPDTQARLDDPNGPKRLAQQLIEIAERQK